MFTFLHLAQPTSFELQMDLIILLSFELRYIVLAQWWEGQGVTHIFVGID